MLFHPSAPCLPCPSVACCWRAGKSCLVDTAVRAGSYGAVHVTVPAGEPAGDIVAAVHAATAGMRVPSPPGSAANPAPSAGRVLAAYALLFGAPVVAVLRAEPHGDGRRYAEAPAAARQLAAFGYRVVVDAAHRALDTAPTAMARSEYVDIAVEPMPRALVERLAGLAPLHAALAAARLADVVWAVAGGYPAAYEQLHTAWAEAGGSSAAITPTVQTFVERKLGDALDLRDCADRCYAPLFERFRAVDAVPAAEARALLPLLPGATPWPPPDGVLRAVRGGRSDARAQQQLLLLVPASPAVGVVLRHGLARVPPLAALAAMVAAEAA